jgi:hypothetical protein
VFAVKAGSRTIGGVEVGGRRGSAKSHRPTLHGLDGKSLGGGYNVPLRLGSGTQGGLGAVALKAEAIYAGVTMPEA